MKTIKIFCLPSHQTKERTSGVDFARIIQPAQHLDGYTDGKVKFKVRLYDIHKDWDLDWQEVAEEHDIIYFNYTALPWEFAKMGLMVRKFNKIMVLDLDDSLWNIMPDNPVYEAYKKGGENIRNFTAICNEVDYITTTSRYLRNVIAHNSSKPTSRMGIMPNFVDLDGLYTHRCDFKDTQEIKLLHFGSTTHFIDLQTEEFEKGIDMVMKDYPNVVFKTVGALIPKYKYKWGIRYQNGFGDQDLYKWVNNKFPEFMDDCDIFVTPLADNKYTRCKSAIKFLEASSAIKPGVWQKIRQYKEVVEEGVNGFLADSAEDWYNAIKKLIDDKKLRQEVAENAFKTVEEGWRIQDNVKLYADFFSSIID